jgi:hypothetical protein
LNACHDVSEKVRAEYEGRLQGQAVVAQSWLRPSKATAVIKIASEYFVAGGQQLKT